MRRRPFWTRWWFWLFLILVVAGSTAPKPRNGVTSSRATRAPAAPAATIPPTATPEPTASSVTAEQRIGDFVRQYNVGAPDVITGLKPFDPQDHGSGYYRTEFRLRAFNGSTGQAGRLGKSAVELVAYGLSDFRIYAHCPSANAALEILEHAARVLDPGVQASDLQDVADDMRVTGDSSFVFGITDGYVQRNLHDSKYPYDLFLKKER